MESLIENNIDALKNLCVHHKVESFYLFGSAATGKLSEKSDLDFLVKFSNTIDLLDYSDNYFDLLIQLQILFNREIDLVSEGSLKNPILINEINKSKISLYES